MSNTGHPRIRWTAFAALLSVAACGGVEDIPPLVAGHEPSPSDRSHDFPSQAELKLCDRRVPPPRC
jgi:hypothetical protein